MDTIRGIEDAPKTALGGQRMILNRLRGAIDPQLRDNRNGFRQTKTTGEQILTLRRIIEEVKSNNRLQKGIRFHS